MSKTFTLNEFIELYRDIDKITAMYFIPDLSLYNKLFANKSENINDIISKSGIPNILVSDEYFEVKDDDYIFNKYKIFEDHKDDIVVCQFFVIDDKNLHNEDFQFLEEDYNNGDISEEEYIEKIGNFSESCTIILSSKKTVDIDDSTFLPKFDSNVNCIVISDVELEDQDENTDPDISAQTLLGVMADDTGLLEFISKRREFYTAVYDIDHGHLVKNRAVIYYTDSSGDVTKIGVINFRFEDDMEEEDNDEA